MSPARYAGLYLEPGEVKTVKMYPVSIREFLKMTKKLGAEVSQSIRILSGWVFWRSFILFNLTIFGRCDRGRSFRIPSLTIGFSELTSEGEWGRSHLIHVWEVRGAIAPSSLMSRSSSCLDVKINEANLRTAFSISEIRPLNMNRKPKNRRKDK